MKKKSILFASLIFLALGMQSCKKTYTCICEYSDGTTETQTLEGGSISELQAECIDICY